MKTTTICVVALFIVYLLFVAAPAKAQAPMPVPQTSPGAVVTQTIGITDVTISYHRPGVKGRKIWGGLVPYGEVWRVGANENTTISFTDPVKIEGQDLPAGKYGLHMIPAENEWTIIFSKNSTSWGSYYYKESEDALRIKVKPQSGPHQELMCFEFMELTNSAAIVALKWENLIAPFKIEVDVHRIVLANARNAYLRSNAASSWQAWNQASNYCLRNSINYEEALTWVDKSISMNENFSNLMVKVGLLEKTGKIAEASTLKERAIGMASEAELNSLGRRYLSENKTNEAIDVFKRNVKAHPDSWSVYDNLAQAYEKSGDKKLAMENYNKAMKMVTDEKTKKRIADTLQKLSAN
jgi:tetratricopeptide (TPR) repeat protein